MESVLELIDAQHELFLNMAEEQHSALRQAVQLSATCLTSQPALSAEDPCPASPLMFSQRKTHVAEGRELSQSRTSNMLRSWMRFATVSSQASSNGSSEEGTADRILGTDRVVQLVDRALLITLLLNAVALIAELELDGRSAGQVLNGGPVDCVFLFCEGDLPSLMRLDLLYFLELLIRLALDRAGFWRKPANWFDAFLVLAGLVNLSLLIYVQCNSYLPHSESYRHIHTLSAFRAVRLVRVLRFCHGLQLFLTACKTFASSLLWGMALLFIFLSMSALIIGNLLQSYIRNPRQDLEQRTWMWEHYGTSYNSIYTLFEVTFAGNWPTNVRPVLENVSRIYVIVFGAYIIFVVFGLVRIITAIFLRDALDAASSNSEYMVLEGMRKRANFVSKLEGVFKAIDEAEDGMISEARLNETLSNPKVKAYFNTLGLPVHEGVALFHLLDNGDGEVTLEEFVDGILRCKGPARAIDQVAIHSEVKQLGAKLSKMTRIFTEVYPALLRRANQQDAQNKKSQPAGVMRSLSMAPAQGTRAARPAPAGGQSSL